MASNARALLVYAAGLCYHSYVLNFLQSRNLDTSMVVLGRVVRARNHGTLSPRLATTALEVNAGSSDVPQLGESARELHKIKKITQHLAKQVQSVKY